MNSIAFALSLYLWLPAPSISKLYILTLLPIDSNVMLFDLLYIFVFSPIIVVLSGIFKVELIL